MTNQHEIEEYNYSVFEGMEDFAGFRTLLQVGSLAADFPATELQSGNIPHYTLCETSSGELN